MRDSAYFLEASTKTRNLGLVMSLIVAPIMLLFIYFDSITPPLRGILPWRLAAIVPSLLFLIYALFLFPSLSRFAIPFHIAQLSGLILMISGCTAELATRADFPDFGRTALISSLVICIFADFVFAGGARKYLAAILFLPLAAMSAYLLVLGKALTQMELIWLIANPVAMAIVVSVLALYQERSSVREYKVRWELRRTEDALLESEKKYHALFENAEVGMFQMEPTSLIIADVNRKCLELTGRARQEMLDTSLATYWADQKEYGEMMRLLARDRHVTNFECRIISAHGEARNCIVSLSLHPEQQILEGSILDITERKRLEAERLDLERRIAASQKLEGLGILAGGVAHNFNNLLTVILGHADLLRETLPRDSAMASSVLEIIKAGYRSRDLVAQLLSHGRQQVLKLRSLDLNVVVRESAGMLRQAIRENIAIDCDLSASPAYIAADPERIEQILLNLALNAQDAITKEGRILIETKEVVLEEAFARRHEDLPPGPYIQLTLSDTGEGMAAETLTRIFTPFFTTKEQGKGTGLGLFTVYGIVKQHNGKIEVESRLASGTRFSIYFPRIGVHGEEPPALKGDSLARGTETILFVEDEAPIRAMLGHHLRSLGYTVLEASDGLSALQVCSEYGKAVHVLVTDVVMPRMNGTDLRDRLRGRTPGLKVLFMSGYSNDVIETYVAKDAEMEIMRKPFTGQALASQIRDILDR
jgi:PAS domain S-box-containing protein